MIGDKKLNKKGFTLVELLAVIVVLAIIMIIAIPAVMDSMNKAKNKSFKMYAQKMLTAAGTKYQSSVLTGTNKVGTCFYALTDLTSSTGNFKGYVIIDPTSSIDNPTLTIYIADNSYYANGVDAEGLETASNIKALDSTGQAITTPATGATSAGSATQRCA